MSVVSSCCAAPKSGPADSLFNPVAAEFAAIGAAIGANCEPCLRHHVREAMKLGITAADVAQAVAVAVSVKQTPAANILKLAARLTENDGAETSAPPGETNACGCSA
jgi:AhpD family alkylhydroperoxidase